MRQRGSTCARHTSLDWIGLDWSGTSSITKVSWKRTINTLQRHRQTLEQKWWRSLLTRETAELVTEITQELQSWQAESTQIINSNRLKDKKLIRRWDSERELSLRRHRIRTTKYNRNSCINSATDRRGYVLERMFTKFSEITQYNGHCAVQGHSRSPILVPIESSYTTSY